MMARISVRLRSAGECSGPRSERSGLDDGEDIGEVAMGMVVGAATRLIMMVGLVVGVGGLVVMAHKVMIVAIVVATPPARPPPVAVHLLDRQTGGLGLSRGEDAKRAAGDCGGPRSERSGLDDGEDIGQTVGLGLSLGKNAKSAAGECSGPRSERSGLDDGEDVGEVAMGMVVGMAGKVVMAPMVMAVAMVVAAPALLAVDGTVVALARMLVPMQVRHVVVVVLMRLVQHHIEVQARNARRGDTAHLEGESLDRQSRPRGAHGWLGRLRVLGRIDHGGPEHIARDTGLAVEPQRAAAASGVASGAIRR